MHGRRRTWFAAVLVVVLGACGEGASSPLPGSGLKVCVVAGAAGFNDHGFNQLALQGAHTTGASVRSLTAPSASDYLSNLQKCAAKDTDLVVAVGGDFGNPVWKAAESYPSVHFAIVDGTALDDAGRPAELPNVTDLVFQPQGAGYLVGALAGLMEKEKIGNATHGVTGILGLNHSFPVDAYIAGYVAGARSVNPTLKIKLAYSDSPDPAACKQIGIQQISGGADILFEVTGGCRLGYISAAYDASAYAIGSDTDLAGDSPSVITSAIKRVDRAVAAIVTQLSNKQFKAGQQVFDLRNDGTGFTTPSSVVPQDIINQVEDVRTKIRSGAITPPSAVPPL
jgi:basic membrane protein A